jgi:hypothetical protein
MTPSKEQIEAGALAIMNERLAQNGVPPLTNLDMLYPQVLLEITADSEAALRAVIVPELQRCERLAAVNAELLAALKDGLSLKGGWREAIVELEDFCSERVRLKNMLAAADQLDRWADAARAVIAKTEGG